MFLADLMRLGLESPPLGPRNGQQRRMQESQIYYQWQTRRILGDFDLYAFTPSALTVAADLLMDTPDRFERVAESVFSRPRKVFIEADAAERLARVSQMRGFPRQTIRPDHRIEPQRVGLAIEVTTPGRATIDVVWCFGRNTTMSQIRELATIIRPETALQKKGLEASLRLGFSPVRLLVDLIGPANRLSRSEFEGKLERMDADVAALIQHFRRVHGGLNPTPVELWGAYRLNQIVRVEPHPMGLPFGQEMQDIAPHRDVFTEAKADYDGEITFAIALLAALEAGERALNIEWRAAEPSRRAEGERKVSPRDIEIDRIATVTMNISDRTLLRAIEAGKAVPHEDSSSSTKRRGPSRHAVRGHLFHARNGKLVYRKPHWRGSSFPAGEPHLTVVR